MKMQCAGKLKLRSHNTTCCLIEVVTKADKGPGWLNELGSWIT